MPQMAPIMWVPLFILISLLVFATKSIIYFVSNKSSNQLIPKNKYFVINWLW